MAINSQGGGEEREGVRDIKEDLLINKYHVLYSYKCVWYSMEYIFISDVAVAALL